jgi:anti-sigma regulatory factor (Ser/Thr protein kinase)
MSGTRDLIRLTLESQDSVTMAEFLEVTGLTRPAVLYHLRALMEAGDAELVGPSRGRSVRYRSPYDDRWEFPLDEWVAEHLLWSDLEDQLLDVDSSDVARNIHEYVFGEMVNNVLDHSGSQKLTITRRGLAGSVEISVRDYGVGIFQHIADAEGLSDHHASLLRLQSGTYTTDPDHHTGQGIFFSARAVDHFSIGSGTLAWQVDNLAGDSTVVRIAAVPGTTVRWKLDSATARSLPALFEHYSRADDDGIPQFAVTSIPVSVAAATDNYATRSAARELLAGKQQFRVIILDFSNVENIGQGFADEVFRVYQAQNPTVQIEPVHMNEQVRFLVDQARGVSSDG